MKKSKWIKVTGRVKDMPAINELLFIKWNTESENFNYKKHTEFELGKLTTKSGLYIYGISHYRYNDGAPIQEVIDEFNYLTVKQNIKQTT